VDVKRVSDPLLCEGPGAEIIGKFRLKIDVFSLDMPISRRS
jgi:hypothetical protein